MEQATPTSPWQPTSAPEIEALPCRGCRWRGGEQEGEDALLGRAGAEAVVVVQHGRDDAGGAVGGRGDDAAAGGVFLVDGQCVEIDPVEDRQRIAQVGLGPDQSSRVQRRRAARDVQAAGQRALLAHPAGHAVLHRLPDPHQAGGSRHRNARRARSQRITPAMSRP
jgi:hypothetical protein